MKTSFRTLAMLITLAGSAALPAQRALGASPLPALGADPAQVSVSGLSSGGYMAVQYQVAYSASVKGAGIIAGGPYYCAAGNLVNTSICMGGVPGVPPNPSLMLGAAQGFAASGKIDALSNLQRVRLYLFSGTQDTVVRQPAVDATATFFRLAGVPSANLAYVSDVPAGHAFITPSMGNACNVNGSPYVNHCTVGQMPYDQAGVILTTIYGTLVPPAAQPTGRVVTFNQREFAPASSGMTDDAYAYVPQACGAGTACKVHVVFHGCLQTAAIVRDDTTYDSWADANGIIVLYPQVAATTVPYNPNGCWDWFAYTGQNYAWKSGVQMQAVHAMIARLVSAP
ncbi:extracellular catalytic domain type 2 short-chain-length polyhydroxyalkanoate depolymerase [Burkholderia sp. FERM BP-3421]|jgi:poly(3-hydroxybutyrate) depolymerase|uniref:extracellular catalytic domain type 2 short-chain-length polyhydroxyalkanoate depolymerase n=1 Tax=Burkholderia sp. FERM BP-3421 TaxID=1494466 RepID=UPI003FCEC09F